MKLLYRNILLSILAAATVQGEDNTTCTTPALFDNVEQPTIHIVMSITTGDFFTQLLEGAKLQAAKIDSKNEVQVAISQSDGDDDVMAKLILDAATDPNSVGILTVDGHADTLCDVINKVTNDTVPVVSFDFNGAKCSDSQILTKQNDSHLAQSVLNQALLNQGMNRNVGYVNDLNYAPLLNRNKVWEEMKAANDWNELFFVDNAANYSSAEALQKAIETAITNSEDEVDFIYAPWDYLSVNTVKALQATSSNGTAVYGADINNDDIQVMTKPESPWKATAGVDPRSVGAALVRMVAISASGNDLGGDDIEIPVELVTQEFLLDNNVTNMDELVLIDPELTLPGFMQACWIDSIVIGTDDSDSVDVVEDEAASMEDGDMENDETSSSDADKRMYNMVMPLLLLIPFTALVTSW